MTKIPGYLNTLNTWAKVLAAVASHPAELSYLAEPKPPLENLFQRADSLSAEHSAPAADKQDTGQRLPALHTRSWPVPPPEEPDPESPSPPTTE